jgi:hypothetical protein
MLDAFRANENGAAPLPLTATATATATGNDWPGWNCRPDKPLTLLTACSDFNALLKMQLFWLARPGCARLEEDLQSDDDAVAK